MHVLVSFQSNSTLVSYSTALDFFCLVLEEITFLQDIRALDMAAIKP